MPVSQRIPPGAALASGIADPAVLLGRSLQLAIGAAFGDEHAAADPQIKPSQNPQFGDYQANVAMGLAKQLGMKPRDVAAKILDAAPPALLEIVDKPEIAGPGFINLRLKTAAIDRLLEAMDTDALGIRPDSDAHSIVIDLCGVNVAKQMHVGHLRATIIGDALARVYERLGRKVFRENHLGDWGLPIAMVLHQLREKKVNLDALTLDDLDQAYRAAQQSAKGEDAAAALEGAKATLVKLQQGDPALRRDWQKLIDCTMRSVRENLDLLDVDLDRINNHGESFFSDRLAGVIDAFTRSGIAQVDDGALVVRFADRERPLLIRKSDGGYLYATTDLAAARFRVHDLGASRVVYVVDARQRDHFRDIFDAAHLIGWDRTADGARSELIHVGFGTVLGSDKKPLKTRSGDNITLKSLLVEAIEQGSQEVERRAASPDAPTHGLPAAELRAIGKAVGIGAVKYADLSNDLVRDYVFNFDRMIAFEGNTGPYMQYAHARVCSIFAKAGIGFEQARRSPFRVAEPAERQLALGLLRYPGVVADVAQSLQPHRLCNYLYDLANMYSTFYNECPVLKADDDAIRGSRLRLCDLVRRVLADGLGLLGIESPDRM